MLLLISEWNAFKNKRCDSSDERCISYKNKGVLTNVHYKYSKYFSNITYKNRQTQKRFFINSVIQLNIINDSKIYFLILI